MKRAHRPSARVIVVDEDGRVLLFRVVDAKDDKPPVWVTPGGAVEPGEDLATAAGRELAEETGLTVQPTDLGSPVAVCRGEWAFRGQPLYSEDWYFAIRVPAFEPDPAGWTDIEQELHHSWRWWPCEELEDPDEVVLPASLATVARGVAAGRVPAEPVELPWTEI